jgi:uncharacterized membrane protein YphA (DoxX/SURF4 family)
LFVIADVTLAARLILAAVFAVAGAAKLLDRDGARQVVRAFAVPRPLVVPVAVVLPVAELAVAAALTLTFSAVTGAVGALVLLALFIAGITVSLARGRQPDCRCFGQIHSAPIGGKTVARNAALAVLAVLVVLAGPGTGLSAWSSRLSAVEWLTLAVAIALAGAFAVEGSALIDRWRQSRRSRSPRH